MRVPVLRADEGILSLLLRFRATHALSLAAAETLLGRCRFFRVAGRRERACFLAAPNVFSLESSCRIWYKRQEQYAPGPGKVFRLSHPRLEET